MMLTSWIDIKKFQTHPPTHHKMGVGQMAMQRILRGQKEKEKKKKKERERGLENYSQLPCEHILT